MADWDVFELAPLEGGHSGETFLADSAGERCVVRVYGRRGAARGPEAAMVDAAVLRLVRGLLPVAEVLEVRRPGPAAGVPAVLITGFLPGTRLDLVLPALDADGRRRVGRHLGTLLARLACMPMPRPGLFVDGDLRTEPLPADDLAAFVGQRRDDTALTLWPPDAYGALLDVADRAQTLLDRVTRTCLVHSDLNPKNLLVDPDTLEVTGVLDWEFAHAGSRPRQPAASRPGPGPRRRRPEHLRRARPGRHRRPHRARARPCCRPLRTRRPRRAPWREPGDRAGARPAARHGVERRPARRTSAPACELSPPGDLAPCAHV